MNMYHEKLTALLPTSMQLFEASSDGKYAYVELMGLCIIYRGSLARKLHVKAREKAAAADIGTGCD